MLKKNIILLLMGSYLIIALMGYQIGWSGSQYDELRLLQLPLALYALLSLIFTKKIEYSIYTKITFFIIAILISIQQINWNIFQFQELWSAIALLFILSILVFKLKGKTYLQHVIALIIVSALIPCSFILISIIKFIFTKQWYDWQFNSGTIRIYDSVIVPLFFS